MIKTLRSATVIVVLCTTLVAPTTAGGQGLPADVLVSDNISLVTSLPNPGVIGARFSGDHMYVTSVAGLTVYDISNPASPLPVGTLPLPHFENEDVDMHGDILLISNDAAESTGILYVIDVADPAAPTLLTAFQMGGNAVEGGPGHTASCVRGCNFAWVTDSGGIKVIDLRDPAAPVDLGTFETPAGGDVATHDVQVDGNGLAWVVGFGGAAAYKVGKHYDGNGLGKLVAQTDERGLSTYFDELGLGDGSNPNDFVLHNSHRERNSKVVYITEEDYARPGCRGAGAFETWKVPVRKKGKNKVPNGKQVTLLDHWQTELAAAGAASPAALCSAHYFDVHDDIVAQGWYEQGTRFLDVSDPTDIRQIGFFSAPNAVTWAAYFAPNDPSIVYSLDASHGIDVLRLTLPSGGARKAKTVTMPIRSEWFQAPALGTATELYGFACRLNLADAVGEPALPVPLP